MKLIIAIAADLFESLNLALQRESSPDWKKKGSIRVIPIPFSWQANNTTNAERVAREINVFALRSKPVTIVLVGKIPFNQSTTESGDLRNLIRVDGMRSFERRVLPLILSFYGLDWRSSLENSLKERWNLEVVTSYDIEEWVEQFNVFGGDYNWIGEALLKLIDPWSTMRLAKSLRMLLEKNVGCEALVCVNSSKSASAHILRNLLGKLLESKGYKEPVRDIIETISDVTNVGKPIFFFEDCLITARETVSMIESLLGVYAGKKIKYNPLPDSNLLRNHDLTLLYPLVTTLGSQRLSKELANYNLQNVKIKFDRNETINVLTPSGQQALEEGRFFDPNEKYSPLNPLSNIIPVAFENTDIIQPSKRDLAKSFCEDLGLQLFRGKIRDLGIPWNNSKFGHCGLGVSGLALTLSFPHSLPKSTLPLYWLGGNIEYGGKKCRWKPLFPGVVW